RQRLVLRRRIEHLEVLGVAAHVGRDRREALLRPGAVVLALLADDAGLGDELDDVALLLELVARALDEPCLDHVSVPRDLFGGLAQHAAALVVALEEARLAPARKSERSARESERSEGEEPELRHPARVVEAHRRAGVGEVHYSSSLLFFFFLGASSSSDFF